MQQFFLLEVTRVSNKINSNQITQVLYTSEDCKGLIHLHICSPYMLKLNINSLHKDEVTLHYSQIICFYARQSWYWLEFTFAKVNFVPWAENILLVFCLFLFFSPTVETRIMFWKYIELLSQVIYFQQEKFSSEHLNVAFSCHLH